MKRQLMLFATLFAGLCTQLPAYAHGDMDHILGTVLSIEGDLVTVMTDGKGSIVYLKPFTRYERAGKVSGRAELHVGDRVVIHAKKKDNHEEAYEVRLMHTE